MKRILLLPILLLSCFVFGQSEKPSGDLKGTVVNSKTSEMAPFVNVVVQKNGVMVTGGQTDFDGNYLIKRIPPGTYDLQVSSIGFMTKRINGVVIEDQSTKFIDIKLNDSPVEVIYCGCFCSFREPLVEVPTDLFIEQDSMNKKEDALLPSTELSSMAGTQMFMAYPNPSDGMMTLTNMPKTDEMMLLDMTGKIIRTIHIMDDHPMTMDLTTLLSGMYFLKYMENGQQKTMKLMRQ